MASLLCQPICLTWAWMKPNPMWETQAATDRLYKLWDTEETPRLLLLAPAFSAATARANIWVNKEADVPDLHQGRASCSIGRMSVTNDAQRLMRTHTCLHKVTPCSSFLRREVMVCSKPQTKPDFTRAENTELGKTIDMCCCADKRTPRPSPYVNC